MPTRIRIVIAFIVGLVSLFAIIPLARNIMQAGTRPQIVVTIPADAAHSPLPYSTPVPNQHGSLGSMAITASSPGSLGQSSPISKLKKPGDGNVNINTASSSEFQRLPGIGPAMASRILTERRAIGRFRKPSDLLEVRGIGPKKFAKMEPFIAVN